MEWKCRANQEFGINPVTGSLEKIGRLTLNHTIFWESELNPEIIANIRQISEKCPATGCLGVSCILKQICSYCVGQDMAFTWGIDPSSDCVIQEE